MNLLLSGLWLARATCVHLCKVGPLKINHKKSQLMFTVNIINVRVAVGLIIT